MISFVASRYVLGWSLVVSILGFPSVPITGFPSLSSSTVFIPVNGDFSSVLILPSLSFKGFPSLSFWTSTFVSLPSFIETASFPSWPSLPSTPRTFLISSDDEASRSFPSLPLIPSIPFSVTPLFLSSPVNSSVLPSLPFLPSLPWAILIPLSGSFSLPPIFTLSNLGALLSSKFILPSLLIEVAKFSPLSLSIDKFEVPPTLIIEPSWCLTLFVSALAVKFASV